jgi:SAM-dependent methyltransferase
MKNLLTSYLLIFACLLTLSCNAQKQSNNADSPYTYTSRSYDGIGKVYMGREISFVMGFAGKDWLDRDTREQEESVKLAIENLPITESSVVADIGAGSGYYTFRIAPKVPNGKVYAVEIQDEAIQYLDTQSKVLGFDNVIPIKGEEKTPNLPENAIDLVIMVDVYHELEFPQEMLTAIKKSLKQEVRCCYLNTEGKTQRCP